jgi:hypothetical protein
MKFTAEEIDCIREMAGLFFTPEEIAINLEVNTNNFINEIKSKSGDAYFAFISGSLTGDLKLRSGIMKAAEHGSHPAQTVMLKIKEDSEIKASMRNA